MLTNAQRSSRDQSIIERGWWLLLVIQKGCLRPSVPLEIVRKHQPHLIPQCVEVRAVPASDLMLHGIDFIISVSPCRSNREQAS